MSSGEHQKFIKKGFNLELFDLTNFSDKEIEYLNTYGAWLEALTFNVIEPISDEQKKFLEFIKPPYKYYLNRREFRFKDPSNLAMIVWGKILTSKEYYHIIKDNANKLNIRNHFVAVYTKDFDIKGVIDSPEVYLTYKGYTKVGDDDRIEVSHALRFKNSLLDDYVYSLFKHEKLGEIIYQGRGYTPQRVLARNYFTSEEGLKMQIESKKIEVEIKINAIKNYSKEEHEKWLLIDDYEIEYPEDDY